VTLPLSETEFHQAIDDPALAARIIVDVNPRARRVSLRVDPTLGCIVLVRPPRMKPSIVMSFVAARQGWIAAHLERLPSRMAFTDGCIIPFRGEDHVVRWRPEARGGVWRDELSDEIIVTGRAEHAPRRLRDWLKGEARAALSAPVHAMAEMLDVNVSRITVRDTRSRWGSCTRDGKISFSWRLILAPEAVMNYVVAHEVAHLEHMNHGPAFWRTVARLMDEASPAFKTDMSWKLARQWLSRSGAALHRYG
jgi:predicted metal-dependent hydrolase